MLILGIDTASKTGSVALYDSEKGLISELNLNIKINHSNTLMKMIDTVLNFADVKIDDLDKVAVSIGPGSFTGIRVGVAAAKGFCYGKNIEINGVNELDILANSIPHTNKNIISLIDARKGRVYFAQYKYIENKIMRISEYRDGTLSEILDDFNIGDYVFTGDGALAYSDLINEKLEERAFFQKKSNIQVKASVLCEMSVEISGENLYHLEPFYLSKTQAERMKEKASV